MRKLPLAIPALLLAALTACGPLAAPRGDAAAHGDPGGDGAAHTDTHSGTHSCAGPQRRAGLRDADAANHAPAAPYL